MLNDNLLKLAQQLNPSESAKKLDASLKNLRSLQQNSLFNEANVNKKIEAQLVYLKKLIAQYTQSKTPQLLQYVQSYIGQIEASLQYLAPDGILHKNSQSYNKYDTILQQLIAELK